MKFSDPLGNMAAVHWKPVSLTYILVYVYKNTN